VKTTIKDMLEIACNAWTVTGFTPVYTVALWGLHVGVDGQPMEAAVGFSASTDF
jgi:hypothetical protein